MIRKFGHSLIALLVIASSTFFVAPMAFCQMEQEEPISCCEQPTEETQHRNNDSDTQCPVCSYDLCNVAPTPAKTEVTTSVNAHLEFVTIPVVTIAYGYADVIPAPAPTIIDTSPPLYLLGCVFRI